jgi:hypothetical protein
MVLLATVVAGLALGCKASPKKATCKDVTCSGHGVCAIAGGAARCVCDAGFGESGADCVACDELVSDGTTHLDVPVVSIEGQFTIGGEAAPANVYETGRIWLESDVRGRVLLGMTHHQSYSARVLPGAYGIYFEVVAGGETVPANRHGKVGEVEILGDTEMNIDIPVMRVFGEITVNNSKPPGSQYDDGNLYLTVDAWSDEVRLGSTRDGQYEALVVPGQYDIRYRLESGGTGVPANLNAKIGSMVLPDAPEYEEAIDLGLATVTGTFTVNGVAPPAHEYDDGFVVLANVASGDLVLLGNTHAQTHTTSLLAGAYQPYFVLQTGGVLVPGNAAGAFGNVVNIDLNTTDLDVDVIAYVVAGRVTINGGTPPKSEYDDGVVYLQGPGLDRVDLVNTHDGDYVALATGGSYGVVYSAQSVGDVVPQNTQARLFDLNVVADDSTVFIDMPVTDVTVHLTINGEQPPISEYEDGLVYLFRPEIDDEVLLGNTHDVSVAARAIQGTYDVVYSVETPSLNVPANQWGTVSTLVVDGPVDEPVDIQAAGLSGALLVNGKPGPVSAYDQGALSLTDPPGRDRVDLGATSDLAYETTVLPGEYEVYYEAANPGAE